MPSATFDIKFRKNRGQIMSPSELKELYFHGIRVADQNGNPISDVAINSTIAYAQTQVENFLNLKLQKQCISEAQDFVLADYLEWSMVNLTYPAKVALKLTGYIGTTKQIEYPEGWFSTRQTANGVYDRMLNLVPNTGTIKTNSVVYLGITPHLGFYNQDYIPNYWQVKYITGFEEVPLDIVDFVGKYAAINLFHILGDLILGAGIANISLGLDGLSQSIATTSSATNAGYGARITGYLDDIKKQGPLLKATYDGMRLVSA